MPLQLGGSDTLRPKIFVWDENNYKQFQEVLQEVEKMKQQGFKLVDVDTISKDLGEVKLIPPSRDSNFGCFRILSQNGDDRVIWDRRDPSQVKDAYKKFKQLMKDGCTAYAATSEGKKGHKITEFDPGLEEIIIVPKTIPG